MDQANQTPTKEYREFALTNNFRKMAQQIIGPFVKMYNLSKNRLQIKLSQVLSQNQELKNKVKTIHQKIINTNTPYNEIQEIKKMIKQTKIQNINNNKKIQTKINKIDNESQKNNIQTQNLKQKIQNLQNSIKKTQSKYHKIQQTNTSNNTNNNKIINQIQQKYITLTKNIIENTSNFNNQQKNTQNLINKINQQFNSFKNNQQQQSKFLQLYLTQRQTIKQQIQNIHNHNLNSINYFDFQAYCQSQKITIQNLQNNMHNHIQQILPQQLRTLFPTIQHKLTQLTKITQIQQNNLQNSHKIQSLSNKITQTQNAISKKFDTYNFQMNQQNQNIKKQIHSKIKQIENKHINSIDLFNLKISQTKIQIKNQITNILQKQLNKIKQTLESNNQQIRLRTKNQVSQQEIIKNAENVKKIQEKISQKFNKIEQLSQTIDFKIENYSSRITKIKSDFQLFSQSMKKQMNSVSKFKVTFQEKLKKLGDLLSNFAQIMMINTSINIQKQQEQFIETIPYENKQQIVFVTENDGIIYQWKHDNPKNIITYRKKQMDTRQFLLSTMFSLITLVDEKLKEKQFLNWNDNKPSQFFISNVYMNYKISQKRVPNYQSQIMKNFNRSQTFRSNHLKPNNSYKIPLQNQQMNQSIDYSIKQFSKTIDTSAKISHPIQQTNYLNFGNDTKKQYSLKRQNLSSSNPKSKIIKDKEGTQRYNDPCFTTRSACRSRISQAI